MLRRVWEFLPGLHIKERSWSITSSIISSQSVTCLRFVVTFDWENYKQIDKNILENLNKTLIKITQQEKRATNDNDRVTLSTYRGDQLDKLRSGGP